MTSQAHDQLQADIDWLVEGELNTTERDALFRRLDGEPDAWKRCALAFVERAALANSLKEIRTELVDESTQSKQLLMDRSRQQSAKTHLFWSLAASLVMAIGVGLGAIWNPPTESLQPLGATRGAIAGSYQLRMGEQDREVWRQVSTSLTQAGVSDGKVIALIGIAGSSQPRLLPIIQSEMLERKLSQSPPAVLPGSIDQQLRSAGFQASHRRQFVAFTLPDGRNEIMPIDLLSYRFIGKQTF